MTLKRGVFLSDVHLPDNIELRPVFEYIKDLKPDIVILGGDIVDAQNMHGCESMKAEAIQMAWYYRDVKLLRGFLEKIQKAAPSAEVVYLEGNHEERLTRIMQKYPGPFPPGTFNIARDAKPPKMKLTWIPYGTYRSFYKLGDMVFTHGTIYPDNHAKRYAETFGPWKVVYGHLHDGQMWSVRTAYGGESTPRYAMTAGCLTHRNPDYKRGAPVKWLNGFISFLFDGVACIPTAHFIERGKFAVGPKVYM